MRVVKYLMLLVLAGCAAVDLGNPLYLQFAEVVSNVEPAVETECLQSRPQGPCDFTFFIDTQVDAPPNAFQALDRLGGPTITFTQSLLEQVGNADEIAFVMSHEAAHHILGHIQRQQFHADQGATWLGTVVAAEGGSRDEVATAQQLGAIVGARSYSKTFELEADALGTLITARAGYSPVLGMAFFDRIPDPGDQFLGTHPSNPDRLRVVQETIKAYDLH